MRRILLVLVVMLTVLIATAQDSDDAEPCAELLPDFQSALMGGSIEQMEAAALIGSTSRWLASARSVRKYLSEIDALCSGLWWASDTEGLQPLIGPVRFPDGLFRVTVTTDGAFTLSAETIEGECEGRSGSSILIISRGQAVDGGQASFRGTGCVAVLEISNARDEWTLFFELIDE